jgi:hypothetical protein
MRRRSTSFAAIAMVAALLSATATRAQTVIDDWSQVKLPPPPQLKPVTLDAKETALLVMDFTVQTCTPERRKRCADSVPKVKKFVEDARAKGALIIYSVAVPGSVATDVLKDLTPAAGEQVLPPLGPDKFINSDLGAAYRRRGGVARLQGDRTGRRDVGGRFVSGSLYRLASVHGGAHQQSDDAD